MTDRLYIKKGDRKIYDKVLGRGSPFYGMDNKIPFLISMLIGYQEGIRIPLGSNKDGWIRVDYLDDNEKYIIQSIAIETEKNLDVLMDINKVYEIAEEYASGGLKLLQDEIFNPLNLADYEKRLELLLTTIHNEILL